jgi:hypothetical protein
MPLERQSPHQLGGENPKWCAGFQVMEAQTSQLPTTMQGVQHLGNNLCTHNTIRHVLQVLLMLVPEIYNYG